MKKYELENMLDSEQSKTDRLIDINFNNSKQFEYLWEEIGQKQIKINNQITEIRRLKDMVDRYRRKLYADKVDHANLEKNFREWTGESVDN